MAFPTSPTVGQTHTNARGVTYTYNANGGWVMTSGLSGGGSLTTGSVTTVELADGTIATVDLAAGSVTSAKLAAGAAAGNLGAGEVTTTMLAANAVTSAKLAVGAVDTTALGANAVTSAKLAAGAVDTAALAASSVTGAKLGTLGDLSATQLQALAADLAADGTATASLAGAVGGSSAVTGGSQTGGLLQRTVEIPAFVNGIIKIQASAAGSFGNTSLTVAVSRDNATFHSVGGANGGDNCGGYSFGTEIDAFVVSNTLNATTTMTSDGSGKLYVRSTLSSVIGMTTHTLTASKVY